MGELSPPDDENDEDYNGDDVETSGGQYADYDDDNDNYDSLTWRCSKSLMQTTQTVCSQSSPLVSLVYLVMIMVMIMIMMMMMMMTTTIMIMTTATTPIVKICP